MNPHNADAYYNYAIHLFDHGELAAALDNLNLAIELRPTYHWAWEAKARLLIKMNRISKARDCFIRALELDPFNEELREALRRVEGNKSN